MAAIMTLSFYCIYSKGKLWYQYQSGRSKLKKFTRYLLYFYTMNQDCADIDECRLFENVCVHGICDNQVGMFKCHCDQGFRLGRTWVLI